MGYSGQLYSQQYYDVTVHKGAPQQLTGYQAAAADSAAQVEFIRQQELQKERELKNELLRLQIEEQRRKMGLPASQ